MNLCGVELTASEIIFAFAQIEDGEIVSQFPDTKKLTCTNPNSQVELKSLYHSVNSLLSTEEIDVVVIRGRAGRGQRSGSGSSFKYEALLLLNSDVTVEIIMGNAITRCVNRSSFQYPEGLMSYQRKAYEAIYTYVQQS